MASSVLSAPMASIGVPSEIKADEQRVALTPDGVKELVSQGLEVRGQAGAGAVGGINDEAFAAAGAKLVNREEAWAAHLVVKVKEPQEEEFGLLRQDMVLFTYLHLAAYPKVGEALLEAGTTGVGYETVQLENGSLPLLAPMSEIAGRLAAQVGAHLLERPHGGRGVLIGGCTGVRPARVVVLGAGTVGWNAARLAAAMDAEVMLLDRSPERLRSLEAGRSGRLISVVSSRGLLERLVPTA
ncbi:MAG TPA: alanine dehydrogenase, partial [Prochlorococcaceae cyanobacterium Gl_MAG_24]|nr:alanine dehydrogenase [Prochlorococcaceae cyanobacterium Gl_MAG_24]